MIECDNIRQVDVFSLSGQMVMTEKFGDDSTAGLDVARLPKGVYIVRVSSRDVVANKKVVIR